MNTKDWFLTIIEAVIWFVFIYYWLYVLKTPTAQLPFGNLAFSAFVLLILAYLGVITCPWVRNSEAWQKMFERDDSNDN